MRNEKNLVYRAIFSTGLFLLLCAAVGAQVVFKPRNTDQMVRTPPAPQQQQAETRRADDRIIRTQPSEEEQPAQRRRTDDAIIRTPRAPRIPESQRPQIGKPYIFASPSQVIVKPGENFGYTGLVWDAGPNHPYAEVWKQVDGGADEFVIEKGNGQIGARIELGKTYTFKLSDFGETLDSVTVTAVPGSTGGGGGTADGIIISRPNRDVENNMITYVTDVRTEPRSNGVAIMFWTTSDARPIVEIGTAAPYESNGKWVFPAGQSVNNGGANPTNIKKVATKLNTFHKFDTNLPGFPELRYETNYWYIITGQKSGGEGTYQTTGRFTTTAPTIGVRVVFEKIHIIDDSDDLSPAEITLHAFVNFGDPSARSTRFQERQMSSGGTFDINKEYVILGAPKRLELVVNAEDDDTGPMAPFRTDNPNVPFTGPGKNDTDQWNVAKDSWDLTHFGTSKNEVYRNPFKLRSMNGGELQFEVTGYWEITRRN